MTGGLYTMWRPYIKQLSFVLGFMCQQIVVRRAAVVFANKGQGLDAGKDHACKTSAHAQGLYFQIGGRECNFTTRMPVFELKSNFISIQTFKAGNVKPPGMHWSKDF